MAWAALTQARHLIRLRRRTIPHLRVLSRQKQCRCGRGGLTSGEGLRWASLRTCLCPDGQLGLVGSNAEQAAG